MRHIEYQEMVEYAAARQKEGADNLTVREELDKFLSSQDRLSIREFSYVWSAAKATNTKNG